MEKKNNTIKEAFKKLKYFLTPSPKWKGSTDYWENRYLKGGNSGSGSYNHLAQFKAEVINKFVTDNNVNTVIEWGCGDGNQLLLAKYPQYVGLDVSHEVIKQCKELFINDENKRFICIEGSDFVYDEKAELALSLDVIFHLVEDDVYETYMKRLFSSSNKYVCIYSCNNNEEYYKDLNLKQHVRPRKFTDWIDKNVSGKWRQKSFVKNQYPYDPDNKDNSSWSDFYFYEISD